MIGNKEPARSLPLNDEIELRDYQRRIRHEVALAYGEGQRRLMVYSPTGSGKTITALFVLSEIWASGKVLPAGTRPYFIVERETLVWQAAETFTEHHWRVSVLMGDATQIVSNADVVVCTAQTLRSRYGEQDGEARDMPYDLGMAVIDEAHLLHKIHIEMFKRLDATLFVGLSATPLRAELGKYYQRLIQGPTIKECIAQGWLVPARFYGPPPPDLSGLKRTGADFVMADSETENLLRITGDVVGTFKRHNTGQSTLVFCCNIPHSDEIARQFDLEPEFHGKVRVLHMGVPKADRQEIIKAFKRGEFQILCSVMMITTGFDFPGVECGIIARPTLSESLWMQMLGRLLRPAEGKTDALILDHAGNIHRFGKPEDFEVGTLDSGELKRRQREKRDKSPDEMVNCLADGCGYIYPATERECPECGHARRRQSQVEVVMDELVDLSTPEGQARKVQLLAGAVIAAKVQLYRELIGYADEQGYKRGWGWHKYKELTGDADVPLRGGTAAVRAETPSNETRRLIAALKARQHRQKFAIEASQAKKRQSAA